MEKYWKELRKNVRSYKKTLEANKIKRQMLEEMKKHLSEEEYLRQLALLDEETIRVNALLVEAKDLLDTPKKTDTYFETIGKLVNLYNETDDPKYKKVIGEEINNKRTELLNAYKQLPEEAIESYNNLYGSIELVEDKELDKISKQQEMFENIIREYNERKAALLNKVGLSYELSNGETLRKEYNQELKEINEEIAIFEKYLNRINDKYTVRAKLVKEAHAAKITPKAYEAIINQASREEELNKLLISHNMASVANRIKEVNTISSEEKEKYAKKIKQYLRKRTVKAAPVVEKKVVETKPVVEEKTVVEEPKVEVNKVIKEELDEPVKDDFTKEAIEEKIDKLPEVNDEPVYKVIKKPYVKEEAYVEYPDDAYGYKTIISNLVRGLEPKKYDGIGYQIENIDIKENFKEEVKTGNYLYNLVHVVPAIVKLPFVGMQKIANKFLYRNSAKRRMQIIKDRLNNLPERDLDILLKEYKNHVEEERYGTGLNVLIEERLEKYTTEKVDKINTRIEDNYKDLFRTMKKVNVAEEKARDKSLSDDERYEYIQYKKEILKGKAKVVESIRNDYNEAKDILSSGMDSFSKASKSESVKNNYVGYRFSKEHNLDTDLLKREAELERAEKAAIQTGNDEMALRVFIENEKLLSNNTTIKKGILGNRSTGKKYYMPLVEELETPKKLYERKSRVEYGNDVTETVKDFESRPKVYTR